MGSRIGFLGPKGTFTEEALARYLEETRLENIETVAFDNIRSVLRAVEAGEVDEGMVPWENTVAGSVFETLDTLMDLKQLSICKEIVIPIRHHLLVSPKRIEGKIEQIFSHPHAVEQCREFITKNFPGVKINLTSSTGEAARLVSESQESGAAIGNARAACIYGLTAMAKDIQDNVKNSTRFMLVGKNKYSFNGIGKTSIVFTLGARAGELYRVLSHFALGGINLTKIESRPTRRYLGEYYIFIDLEGDETHQNVQEALLKIRREMPDMRVLGSYPVYHDKGWGSNY